MAYAGDIIAQDVRNAFIEAAQQTGRDKELAGTLIHVVSAAVQSWPPTDPAEYVYPCICLFGEWDRNEAASGLAEGFAVKVMMASYKLPVVPAPQDRLLLNGIEYTIDKVSPQRPGGLDIFYTLACEAITQPETP